MKWNSLRRAAGFGPQRPVAALGEGPPDQASKRRAVVLRSGTADSATRTAKGPRPSNATRSATDASDASLNDPVPARPRLRNTGRGRKPKPRPRRGLETKHGAKRSRLRLELAEPSRGLWRPALLWPSEMSCQPESHPSRPSRLWQRLQQGRVPSHGGVRVKAGSFGWRKHLQPAKL